jgi:hypothetical protein
MTVGRSEVSKIRKGLLYGVLMTTHCSSTLKSSSGAGNALKEFNTTLTQLVFILRLH